MTLSNTPTSTYTVAPPVENSVSYGVVCAVLLISVCSVVARLGASRVYRRAFGLDDALLLCTLAIYIGMFTATVIYIQQQSYEAGYEANYVAVILSMLAIMFAKLSLAGTFRRSMLQDRRRKILLYGASATLLLGEIVSFILLLTRCSSIEATLTPDVTSSECIDPVGFVAGVYVPQLITDMMFLVLPFFCGNGKSMRLRTKIASGLIFVLGLGAFLLTAFDLWMEMIAASAPEVSDRSYAPSGVSYAVAQALSNAHVALVVLAVCLCSALGVFGPRAPDQGEISAEKTLMLRDHDDIERQRGRSRSPMPIAYAGDAEDDHTLKH